MCLPIMLPPPFIPLSPTDDPFPIPYTSTPSLRLPIPSPLAYSCIPFRWPVHEIALYLDECFYQEVSPLPPDTFSPSKDPFLIPSSFHSFPPSLGGRKCLPFLSSPCLQVGLSLVKWPPESGSYAAGDLGNSGPPPRRPIGIWVLRGGGPGLFFAHKLYTTRGGPPRAFPPSFKHILL